MKTASTMHKAIYAAAIILMNVIGGSGNNYTIFISTFDWYQIYFYNESDSISIKANVFQIPKLAVEHLLPLVVPAQMTKLLRNFVQNKKMKKRLAAVVFIIYIYFTQIEKYINT